MNTTQNRKCTTSRLSVLSNLNAGLVLINLNYQVNNITLNKTIVNKNGKHINELDKHIRTHITIIIISSSSSSSSSSSPSKRGWRLPGVDLVSWGDSRARYLICRFCCSVGRRCQMAGTMLFSRQKVYLPTICCSLCSLYNCMESTSHFPWKSLKIKLNIL